jgi:hypothetical protein
VRESQRVGSIRVSRVSVDLQERGIEVFLENGINSFDMVAHKAGALVRIEVKGPTSHSNNSAWYDVLARVITDGQVQYPPSLRMYLRHKVVPNPLFQELIGDWKPSMHTTNKRMEAAR